MPVLLNSQPCSYLHCRKAAFSRSTSFPDVHWHYPKMYAIDHAGGIHRRPSQRAQGIGPRYLRACGVVVRECIVVMLVRSVVAGVNCGPDTLRLPIGAGISGRAAASSLRFLPSAGARSRAGGLIDYFCEAFVVYRSRLNERGYADLVALCQVLSGLVASSRIRTPRSCWCTGCGRGANTPEKSPEITPSWQSRARRGTISRSNVRREPPWSALAATLRVPSGYGRSVPVTATPCGAGRRLHSTQALHRSRSSPGGLRLTPAAARR